MRLRELEEAPELPTTINAVATDIGNNIMQLFRQMDIMLDRLIEKNKSSDGFGFIAGSAASRWMHNNWDRLNMELFDLARQAGPRGQALKSWLNLRQNKFFDISTSLPSVLVELGQRLGSTHLSNNAKAWEKANNELWSKFSSQETPKEEPAKTSTETKPKVKSTLPQQNVQAEQMVNAILSTLPAGVAGEIRNAIARAPNKLQALQAEIARRGITL